MLVEVKNLKDAPLRARKRKDSKRYSAIAKGDTCYVEEANAKKLKEAGVVEIINGGTKK